MVVWLTSLLCITKTLSPYTSFLPIHTTSLREVGGSIMSAERTFAKACHKSENYGRLFSTTDCFVLGDGTRFSLRLSGAVVESIHFASAISVDKR